MKKKYTIWKTNIKITNTFLILYLIMLVLIIGINISIAGIGLISFQHVSNFNPEKFTRNFEKHIILNNNTLAVTNEGKTLLKKSDAWLQILDENLYEKYSIYKPSNIPSNYTTFELLHNHKYDVNKNTIFIYNVKNQNEENMYLIGFPLEKAAKHTLIVNPSEYYKLKNNLIIIFIIDVLIIVLLAYIVLARKFAAPINNIINAVDALAHGNYSKKYVETGIFKHVFSNLNSLGSVLNNSLEKRKEVEKIRNEWISSISHDLKTPLSSIKGFAEIMKNNDYNFTKEEIINYSNIIYSKSMYIQTLIDDLNLTNKLKNKLIPLKLTKVDLNNFLVEIVIEILNNPNYSKYDISFIKYDADVLLDIDKDLMKRAIVNLIVNALKHNDNTVKVKISLTKTTCFNISIKDNGKGINKEDLTHIFNKYYRGTNTSSSIEGSGLGMAIAKDIIQSHNGDILVNSTKNEGTEVVIKLY